MTAQRENRVIVIAGQRRSGKSTLTSILARQAMAAGAGPRVKVISPSGDLGGSFPDDLDEYIEGIVAANEKAIRERRSVPTSLIVFDDADMYLPLTPKKKSAWVKLYLCSAQLGIDVIYSCKRPQALAPALIQGADYLYLFRLPPSDVSGRERLLYVIDAADIPTVPFEFVAVDPNSGKKWRGRTKKNKLGMATLEIDR